jgi:hypothetical protein
VGHPEAKKSGVGRNQNGLKLCARKDILTDPIEPLFEGTHSVEIFLLLHRRGIPLAHKDIMSELGLKNWGTMAKTLGLLRRGALW